MVWMSNGKQYWWCSNCKEARLHREKQFPHRWECSVCGNYKDLGRR